MRRAVAAAIFAVAAVTAAAVTVSVAVSGPNEHANSAGYRVIARAFRQAGLS